MTDESWQKEEVGSQRHIDKTLLKAGRAYHKYKAMQYNWLCTRGVAMNPVDHPHVSGNHQHIRERMTNVLQRMTSGNQKSAKGRSRKSKTY